MYIAAIAFDMNNMAVDVVVQDYTSELIKIKVADAEVMITKSEFARLLAAGHALLLEENKE